MKSIRQFLAIVTLAATFFAPPSFAQQDDKALLQDCLRAQAKEFQPLVQQQSEIYKEFTNRAAAIRNIKYWLEEDYKTADVKRIQEIAALEARLKVLKDNANLTRGKAASEAEASEDATHRMLKKLDDARNKAVEPLSRKLSALRRNYKRQEIILDPVMMGLFRERGNTDATTNLKKSFGTFSFSSGTASATYKRKDALESAAICFIYLVNDKVGKKKYGLFNDKHPIVYRSQHKLEILVGQTRVTISSSDKAIVDNGLDAALSSLVDIKKLESMLAP